MKIARTGNPWMDVSIRAFALRQVCPVAQLEADDTEDPVWYEITQDALIIGPFESLDELDGWIIDRYRKEDLSLESVLARAYELCCINTLDEG